MKKYYSYCHESENNILKSFIFVKILVKSVKTYEYGKPLSLVEKSGSPKAVSWGPCSISSLPQTFQRQFMITNKLITQGTTMIAINVAIFVASLMTPATLKVIRIPKS